LAYSPVDLVSITSMIVISGDDITDTDKKQPIYPNEAECPLKSPTKNSNVDTTNIIPATVYHMDLSCKVSVTVSVTVRGQGSVHNETAHTPFHTSK